MVSPTKRAEHAAKTSSNHTVKVVTKHRLAEGAHSSVFPEHIGENHWYQGARNGHLGTHTSPHHTKK